MLDLDAFGPGQRGNGPGDARDAGTAATGKREPLDGPVEQLGRGRRPPGRFAAQATARSDDPLAHG